MLLDKISSIHGFIFLYINRNDLDKQKGVVRYNKKRNLKL